MIEVLALIGGLVVVLTLYAVIRDTTEDFRESRKRKCPHCRLKYKRIDNFCRRCGTRLHDGKYPIFKNDSKPAEEPAELKGTEE